MLAGGRSSCTDQDKNLKQFGGKPLNLRVVETLRPLVREIILLAWVSHHECGKGGALQAAEKLVNTVILRSRRRRRISHCLENTRSEILRSAQDDSMGGFFAACLAPPLQGRPDDFQVPHPAQLAAASCAGCGTNRGWEPRFRRG